MFRFTYTLDDNDYFEASKYHYFNSTSGRRAVIACRIFIPALFAALLYFSALRNADFSSSFIVATTIILAIGTILLIILTKPLLQSGIKRNIQNLKKTGKLPYSQCQTLLFEDDAFTTTTPEADSKFKYSAIERIVEADKAVHIYTSAIHLHLIPFRVFLDSTQKQQFIAFVQSRITANQASN